MPIYMQIDGINGNVTTAGHEKWIQLESMQFGVGRGITSAGIGQETNREASTVSISEIQITKIMDETSPSLFIEACIGKGKTVKIHFMRTGDQVQSFMEYTLNKVLISSYSMETSGEGHPNESLSLNFDKIEMKYTPYDDQNQPKSPVPAGYDLVAAKKV